MKFFDEDSVKFFNEFYRVSQEKESILSINRDVLGGKKSIILLRCHFCSILVTLRQNKKNENWAGCVDEAQASMTSNI